MTGQEKSPSLESRPAGNYVPGLRARSPKRDEGGGAGTGRTKSSDSQGETWPRESARVGWGGAADGHASTPVTGAGSGSTSLVWACRGLAQVRGVLPGRPW